MKKFTFSLLLTTIYFAVNAQFNSAKDPFLVKSLTNESFGKINASTSHGNISVDGTAAGDARIEVYARASGGNQAELSKEEIQQRLDEYYTLEVSVSGGVLTAIAKQKINFTNWKKALSISFKIYASQNISTHLRTSHGNVALSGLTGSQDIATSHGNLSLEKISGKLTGETSHGNISISDSKDELEFSTSHGNVDAKNCEGTIKLITSQGYIHLKELKGKTRARTSHGNVDGDTIEGELSATTSHGNIDLGNLSCSVETSTSHGNISLQLPKGKGVALDLRAKGIKVDAMENFSGSKEEHSMKGTLNGGGVTIKAETGKGNISLSFR